MSQTIMIVDDSPTLVKFVAFSLKQSGYEVITACDGMDAVEKLSNQGGRVDLVITDLNMPNLDGYGLISTLRANEMHRETPIIILSSESEDSDIDRGMEVGATSYLVKPFKSSLLLEEVSKFLKQADEAQ
ncbi:MAG TPA: response regulator [candidate division Zixibacteria bacterium]|nr:response regulator [candidate division Zixibacteria bacterium]